MNFIRCIPVILICLYPLNSMALTKEQLMVGLNCSNQSYGKELTEGVRYCETEYTNELNNKDTYKLVVIDRSEKKYRLRPISEFSYNYVDGNKVGRFITKAVSEHISHRGGTRIISAINGDAFSTDHDIWDKAKNLVTSNDNHIYGKPARPDRDFIVSGINIYQPESAVQVMLNFSSSLTPHGLEVSLLNHHILSVKDEHDFSTKYHCEYNKDNVENEFCDSSDKHKNNNTELDSFIGKADLSLSAKSYKKYGNIRWAMGLTQGTILGNVYGSDPEKIKKLSPGEEDFGSRTWYDNACWNYDESPEDDGKEDIISIFAFSQTKIIMGVSTSKIVKNLHACKFFNSLGMQWAGYMDSGGSSQLVTRKSDYSKNNDYYVNANNIDKETNEIRPVLSALALIEDYKDVSFPSTYITDNCVVGDVIKCPDKYANAIYTMSDLGLFSGDVNGNFRPNDYITKAEFFKILIRLRERLLLMPISYSDALDKENTEKKIKNYFDYDKDHWFFSNKYAHKVYKVGIGGHKKFGDLGNVFTFDINGIVTFEVLAKGIVQAFIDQDLKDKEGAQWYQKYFECLNNRSSSLGYKNRFNENVKILSDKGDGIKTDNPKIFMYPYVNDNIEGTTQDQVTRGEMASAIYNAFVLWQDRELQKVCRSI